MSLFADVVFALPLPRAFTYAVPEALAGLLRPGQRVRVPLRSRPAEAFVVRTHDQAPPAEAKPILELIDAEPVIPADILDLTARLSRRFLSSQGEMLRTALPPALRSIQPASKPAPKARRRAAAPQEEPLQMGLDFRVDGPTAAAIQTLTAASAGEGFRPFLLTGPPGRRTAAVLALCGQVLAAGRSVLALFPEIGMSRAVAEAFAARLGEKVVFLHGGLSGPARERALRRIAEGRPCVAAGPRSAALVPVPSLGLLVVDEESDESYRQAESPAYDARDAAWMRAEAAGIRLVLSAEAPRVETFEKARRGGWLVEIAGPPPRPVEIVDDRGRPGILARAVAARIGEALDAGRRVLVFARRKGYASLLFCPRCGHVPSCDRCGAALGLTGRPRRLRCRRCDFSTAAASACPACGGRTMEPSGPGVEAVEEEVRRLWPRARAAGFDPDRVRTASARAAVLERFAHGRLDILIGSPLLAHQPAASLASLAVLLNPEGILGLTDFRASERLYAEIRRPLRLLDRGDPRAAAVLQTSWPDHFALRAAAAGDYQAFFEEEIFRRRSMGDPPFSSLAEIVLTAADPRALDRAARETAERLRASDARLDVLGPAESFRPGSALAAKEPSRTAGRGGTRSVQIIVRADDPALLDEALGRALRDVAIRKSVARAG